MSNLMFALSAALFAVTASAQAAEPKDQPAASPTQAAMSPAAKAQRYCVKDPVTGSRIPQKTCMTRDEWLRNGFDPLKPNG